MPVPRIAVAPAPGPGFVRDAVEAGGGKLVDADEAEGLIWANPIEIDSLVDLLAANPHIRWVQLPWRVSKGSPSAESSATDGNGRAAKASTPNRWLSMLWPSGWPASGLCRTGSGLRWSRPAGRTLYDGRVTISAEAASPNRWVALLQPFRVDITVVRRSNAPFDHRPRRPRQVDAVRPHPRADRRRRRPRHARAVPRLDGHRARAGHHHQGPERAGAAGRATSSTSSTRPATSTSATR